MRSRSPVGAALAALLALAPALPAQVNARMFKQPDVSATHIAFVYAGDIWVVPKAGGVANRLSSPLGEESFPRFSPDGSKIAYSANYDGNQDVYVVPTMGGTPVRVTYHPMPDRLVDWYPDGQALLIASARGSEKQRFNQFYRVAQSGGLPQKLPMPYAEFGAIMPDGKSVAYMNKTRDERNWKRYRGGWAPDIWMFNLETMASANLTANDANDGHPMFRGRTMYFMSDRDENQRNNIWAYDLDSKQTREITHVVDFDMTYPAIGPNDIVFEAGGKLHLLELASNQTREVRIDVVTDLATLRPRAENVQGLIVSGGISPTGMRAIFEARGDVFSVPAEHGPVVDLTSTSGVAERSPSWSPDGKWLAYFSDRSGEYELTIRPADGTGSERKLTTLGPGFRYAPTWSPDSKKIAFVDQTMTIRVHDVAAGRTTKVDQALYWYEGQLQSFSPSWSSDSRWMVYSRDLDNRSSAVFAFDARNSRTTQLTSGYYSDNSPAFDPDGKYLYYLTNRNLQPIYSDYDNTWIYPNTTVIAAVALRPDVPSPIAPRNDVEKASGDSAAPATPAAKPDSGIRAVEIDTVGFERRVVILPPKPGNYAQLTAVSGKVIYRRLPRTGSLGDTPALVYYDLKDRAEKTIAPGVAGYTLSADGKKMLVSAGGAFSIINVAADQKLDKKLRTAEMTTMVSPREEWKQIFDDTWRIARDYFYDRQMHGVDWNAMRTRYGALVDAAVTRWDVNVITGQLIAELNSSHTYRGGGDLEAAPNRNVGLLGVDWKVENGAYRIDRIVRGAAWDTVRSPLDDPGVDVKAGDYVLAVNGVPLETSKEPYAAFAGLAGTAVELTVNAQPGVTGARQVLVQAAGDETRLRHLEWIERNRRRVEEATNGRVGYIYVPSTGVDGQTELERQFMAQFTKPGLIIDERFNDGGQIPDRFIELLDRKPLAFWAVRDGKDWQWPPAAHFGPKVMLINGWSGSGGDAFPNYFREAGLGPLIGLRTWGGLIGISGGPPLIDGGGVQIPTFRQYDPRGKWFAEGHGVDPDIEVVDDPTELAKGRDPQLERAIQEALRLLTAQPPITANRPQPENRTAKRGGGR